MIKINQISKGRRHKITRAIFLVAGTLFLALGAVGIFLPVLPTTPFLLLSAACYLRSSERMHKWLLNNRWFGEYIKNYQAGRGIPIKTKIVAISALWATILFSTFFVVSGIIIAQLALLIIAIGVSAHLIRIPTFRKNL